jgi:hypothetical protein
MPYTEESRMLAEQTAIKKYGSKEAWKKSLSERGTIGGKKEVPKGFALNKDLARKASKKGLKVRREKQARKV